MNDDAKTSPADAEPRSPVVSGRGRSWLLRSSPAGGASGRHSTLSADLRSSRSRSTSAIAVGGLRMTQDHGPRSTPGRSGFRHVPVMAAEVVELFAAVPPGLLVDATVGGGGHAAALLESFPARRLLGIDRDEDAVAAATARLAAHGRRATVVRARFDELGPLLAAHAPGEPVAGVLFDLGVSSYQLDEPTRGFSYRVDAPLDMRMDRREPLTAADLVNSATEGELAVLFAAHGEGRFARRLARAVVAARPLATTGELAEVVRRALPARARLTGGHPAKRVFQALRVAVNRELDVLGPALDAAVAALAPGGRIVVISYHSGEDRIVKERLADAASGGCRCPVGLPCVCGARPLVRLLTRGARLPGAAERAANPRAQSARLRAAQRLAPGELS